MKNVVIVSACRTAIGKFGGALKDVPLVDLGSIVIKECLKRAGLKPEKHPEKEFLPEKLKNKESPLMENFYHWEDGLKEIRIDEVIMGNVLSAGHGQNVTRQSAVRAGIPIDIPAFTVNKVCASGMKALHLAYQAIKSGEAEIVIAGGMESMSQTPYAVKEARWGIRMFDTSFVDLMVLDGLWEIFYGYHMGVTAENIAELYGISREEQDLLGLKSHEKALKAIEKGYFKEEIVPVQIKTKEGIKDFETDERPMKTSLEKMAKLPPVFKKDGTITAGNASGINDGAAALLLMSEEKAKELSLKPLARILGFAFAGVEPAFMGLGPVSAVKKLLSNLSLSIKEIDLFELNEAFASQAIACIRELGLPEEKVNIYGSGISLGHPIGCTGARIVVTLAYALKRHGLKKGIATLCVGGGMGAAICIENCS